MQHHAWVISLYPRQRHHKSVFLSVKGFIMDPRVPRQRVSQQCRLFKAFVLQCISGSKRLFSARDMRCKLFPEQFTLAVFAIFTANSYLFLPVSSIAHNQEKVKVKRKSTNLLSKFVGYLLTSCYKKTFLQKVLIPQRFGHLKLRIWVYSLNVSDRWISCEAGVVHKKSLTECCAITFVPNSVIAFCVH